MIVFQAKKISTGETRTFTFRDLYGYEGEENGVFINSNESVEHLSDGGCWTLNNNSGSGMDGMNPDLEITVLDSKSGIVDWDKLKADSLELIEFYNKSSDNESSDYELSVISKVKTKLANIAACLIDGERFLAYLEKSPEWQISLFAAARIHITLPRLGIWEHEPLGFQHFLAVLRHRLLLIVPRKQIYSAQQINHQIDIAAITQMLKELWQKQGDV
jgi:hypothetical protein